MAVGTPQEILARLRALMPKGWLPEISPIADALLNGFAALASQMYFLTDYAKRMARIKTAEGGWLDLAALGFFGLAIKRRPSQTDTSMREMIPKEVFRERATRPGIKTALEDLTGNEVKVFEAFNPQDTGGFGVAFAFNAAGAWGSRAYPYTIFLDVIQPQGAGIPNMSGLNAPQSGWGAGMFFLADLERVTGEVTNQDVYDTVERTRAAGIKAWVAIVPPPINVGTLDFDFILDESNLG